MSDCPPGCSVNFNIPPRTIDCVQLAVVGDIEAGHRFRRPCGRSGFRGGEGVRDHDTFPFLSQRPLFNCLRAGGGAEPPAEPRGVSQVLAGVILCR